jgi:hypothetical protein
MPNMEGNFTWAFYQTTWCAYQNVRKTRLCDTPLIPKNYMRTILHPTTTRMKGEISKKLRKIGFRKPNNIKFNPRKS